MPVTCTHHPDRQPHGVCTACGRPVCDLCIVELSSGQHCKVCLEARLTATPRPLSGFLRFVLSLIPGAGHMYMGLMNRGLQLMIITGLSILLFAIILPPFLGVVLPLLFFYSVFDAREAYLRLRHGGHVPDTLLVNWSLFANNRWVAYGLISLGVIGIYHALIGQLTSLLPIQIRHALVNTVEGTFVGMLAIGLGVWLLKRAASGPGARDGGGEAV